MYVRTDPYNRKISLLITRRKVYNNHKKIQYYDKYLFCKSTIETTAAIWFFYSHKPINP